MESANHDGRRKIAGDTINFFARYDIDAEDEPPVPHVLAQEEYKTI